MGSLCAFIFFWQALFVHRKSILTKKMQKNSRELNPRQPTYRPVHIPLYYRLKLS